jgi:phosphoribosylamine--glycine ligase
VKVLVVGSGGREHALVWALRRSPQVKEIHIAPGNGGTSECGRNVPIAAEDVPGLSAYAAAEGFDLVVIGPEIPLALGLSDVLGAQGVRVFGPSQAAARIESSKAFSKDFMRAHGIPTAEYVVLSDYDEALAHLESHPAPIVVKASGLAAGKGAIVCKTDEEARQALDQIMRARVFGEAGDQVVIEECLTGQEVSVLAFADGRTVVPMVLAQDHKPVYDGDLGPNTGGMGCYAPAPVLDEATLERVMSEVLQPAVDGLAAAGTPYVGALYAGLMVSEPPSGAPATGVSDFRVLEFNCRFGDPEAQVILPLLETDLVDIMQACIDGHLADQAVRWAPRVAVCVVMASGGYPGHYARGHEISGLDCAAEIVDTVIFHAGTRRDDAGRVLTAGGRVLGVTAWAPDLAEAIARAYRAVDCIHWPDAMYRSDIGAKGLGKG